ncbi:Major facilitator superfamily domain general substrate transporter protein [Rutstroemia sp. NJR-2017a BBW]|nr:Major facilitator superfamily domain general substrate transporter protein [Rutstroemia sp. NJR-2017a BBW]
MGGFVIRIRDGVTWPLDANEILYLIDEGWIKEPVISTQLVLDKGDIDDRNKQNTLVRIYAVVQILWFLINCIARGFQRLAITTLELTTIGFIITTISVSLLWLNKPTDIETRRIIDIDVTIPEIYARAGRGHIDWYDTPLDFLKPERAYYEVAWRYCLNILSAMFMMRKNPTRPIRWRRDDNFPTISNVGVMIVSLCGFLSWGINVIAWNFDFPTILERQAWRLKVLLPALFCGAAYIIARTYLLVEDVIAFRGQNPDIYKTLNWVDFLPYI